MRKLSLWKLLLFFFFKSTEAEDEGRKASTPPLSMNNEHMDSLLPHGVNRQQRHSDMSSCVWTDLLKV